MTDPVLKPAPPGFLWGTAISAHQSEGNNVNADAWICENVTPTSIASHPATRATANRRQEDLEMALTSASTATGWHRMVGSNLNGDASSAELDSLSPHIEGCHRLGLKPMVTYNHFASAAGCSRCAARL